MKQSVRFGLCLLFFFLLASPAFAHATLLQSTPADGAVLSQHPDAVQLTFSETLEPELIQIQLYNWKAEAFDLPPPQLTKGNAAQAYATLPADLEEGSYRVLWSVVSEDGHTIKGQVSFAIGAESAEIVPIAGSGVIDHTTGTTLHLIVRYAAESILLVIGGLYLLSLFAARLKLPPASELLGRWKKAGWVLLLLLTMAEAVTCLAMLQNEALEAVFLQGRLEILIETPFLVMLLIQLALLLMLTLPGMMSGWPLLIFALLIVNLALSGHAFATEPVWLALILRMLHLLSIAAWLGGLCYLLLLWRRPVDRSSFRTFFLRVFLGASTLIALTGAVMVGMQTDWSLVFAEGSFWSGLLYSKISLMAVMLVLAAVQSLRWRKQASLVSYPTLRIEWLLGLLVILAGVWMSMIAHP